MSTVQFLKQQLNRPVGMFLRVFSVVYGCLTCAQVAQWLSFEFAIARLQVRAPLVLAGHYLGPARELDGYYLYYEHSYFLYYEHGYYLYYEHGYYLCYEDGY